MPRLKDRTDAFPRVKEFESQGITLPIQNEEDIILLPVCYITATRLENKANNISYATIKAENQGLLVADYNDFVESGKNRRNQADRQSLRPAADVLSRITFDYQYDERKFVVGYTDRHIPEAYLEKRVLDWNTEITHEDFIPQHRIEYLRSTEPDLRFCGIVWARKAKYDAVFKSGFS